MKRIICRIQINRKFIISKTIFIVGGTYAIFGFLGTFLDLSQLFPEDWIMLTKIFASLLLLCAVIVTAFIISYIWLINSNIKKVFQTNNNKALYVLYNDIFNKEITKENNMYHVVIPVNRCFDVDIDNELISEVSIHGQAFNKLYDSDEFTPNTLNNYLIKNLNKQNIEYETLTKSEKNKGNLKRYEPGTIVTLKITDRNDAKTINYVFLALSYIDNNLAAQTSLDDFILAIKKLFEFCYNKSQGFPIVMPLIGTNFSRLNLNENDVLEYIISYFKLNRDKIKSDVYIVVNNKAKETIPISTL